MNVITLTRWERIKMFLNEYYLGHSGIINGMRIIGGPLMLLIGINFYSNNTEKFAIGFGGFVVLYSIYYTLKPFIWMLFYWKSMEELSFKVEATDEHLIVVQDDSESRTGYSQFNKILNRKTYFAFEVSKGVKIYLPKEHLSPSTIMTLQEKANS